MNTRITFASLVIDFEFDYNKIGSILKRELERQLESNGLRHKSEWELQFRATYSNARQLLVSKNKLGTFTSDKIKEITVVIPIPLKSTVGWGVNKEQHVYDESHYDKVINNFWALEVCSTSFENRSEYIIDCMIKAIQLAFEKGFTINGLKIKRKSAGNNNYA